MALSVQTNNAAVTALKHLNTNSANMNKSLERLSSGFRINSAADDAAGFAISSKLDAQSTRLKSAALNVTQAQAMVKTADAGVNEIQNMVIRLQSLATQAMSANNSGELSSLDAERSKLESTINKIANSTEYNGTNLLNGSAGVSVTTTAPSFTPAEGLGGITLNGASASTNFTVYLSEAANSVAGTFGAGDKITMSDGTTTQTLALSTLPTGANTTDLNFSDLGVTLTINSAISGQTTAAAGATTTTAIGSFAITAGSSQNFQVGANVGANNQVSVSFTNSYTTTSLGITGAYDLTSAANAELYAGQLTTALNNVVSQRADLGATQNQLDFVAANLATSIEQSVASVSSIRDADMAAEMANFTKNQILTQAGTSMLAQANQAAQNVLSLFR